jgi:hypothetical protein
VVYAPWAFIANLGHGTSRALRAGCTQGILSFVCTLTLTQLMEALFRVPRSPWRGFGLALAGAVSASSLLNVTAHAIAGTPEIVRTVAPVLAIGSAFFVSYGLNLVRVARVDSAAAAKGE